MNNPLKPTLIPSPINPTGEPPNNDAETGRRRVAIAEEVEWLTRLAANEDFQRFVKGIKSESTASRRAIRNVDSIATLTAEQRAAYGQKLVLQLDLAEWVDDRLVFCLDSIKAMDEQRKVQS